MHDLIVVGAGPVGSYLASACAPDMDVLVLEEHKSAGSKACSGLVSERIMRLLPRDVSGLPGLVQHEVNGARIHVDGGVFELRKKKKAAYVIDRDLLDRKLAELSASLGSRIMYGQRAENILVKDSRVSVKCGRALYDSKLVAGCDGSGSVVAGHIGSRPAELLNGLMAVENVRNESDYVEMWLDRKKTDGFFWKIPRGSRTEYGAMGTGIGFPQLVGFFGLGNRSLEKSAAPIPMGLVKTFSERVLLAGDSACQTKPWSGGGITYGLICARAAAAVIKKAHEKNDFSGAMLSGYENSWRRVLLRDMQAGLMMRRMYKSLGEHDISGLTESIGFVNGFQERVDFDFPFSSILGDVPEI
jgi:geranylgeranyl reductase family protein